MTSQAHTHPGTIPPSHEVTREVVETAASNISLSIWPPHRTFAEMWMGEAAAWNEWRPGLGNSAQRVAAFQASEIAFASRDVDGVSPSDGADATAKINSRCASSASARRCGNAVLAHRHVRRGTPEREPFCTVLGRFHSQVRSHAPDPCRCLGRYRILGSRRTAGQLQWDWRGGHRRRPGPTHPTQQPKLSDQPRWQTLMICSFVDFIVLRERNG